MSDLPCREQDPEIWFPDERAPDYEQQLRAACDECFGCPAAARLACLEGALERREAWGVWGGMGPEDRHRLQRRREKASA